MSAPVLDIRRADDRLKSRISWLDAKHSFSNGLGDRFDPANTHHGLLVVNNDDTIMPGKVSTPTRIVTWRS